jgi:predicted MFS family arabinose efflux permease
VAALVNPTLYTGTFWLACAIHFTGAMSFGMFLLFPLFIRALGGEELTIGLVLGVGLAASVAVRPLIGSLLDRFGRRRVLLWSGAANVVSFFPFLLLGEVGPALFVLATVHLVIGGALFAAYFTYAADLVPAARRVEGIAIFGIAGMAPNGIGPALGEVLIARAGWLAFFGTATAFALLSLALTTRVRDVVRERAVETGGVLRDVLRLLAHGGLLRVMLATLIFGAGINAAFYFVAPFTRDLGIARAAPFYVAYAATTIVLRFFGRQLPDRLGAHPIAIPAFGFFAAGLAALVLLPLSGMLVVAGIACGAGHGSLFPVLNGLAVARTPPPLHGTVVSLYTAALDAGAVIGTPLCGAIAHVAGYRVMYAAMALVSLGGLALVRLDALWERRRAVPAS